MGNSFSPSFVRFIVKGYIGQENYNHVHRETQKLLWAEAIKQFQLEMIQKFGSLNNYQKDRCIRRGFKSGKDYTDYLIKLSGAKNYSEYKDILAKESGFKSRYDRMVKRAQSQGYKSLYELYNERYRKRGFQNQKEYREYLAKKNGVKYYHQIKK